MCIIKSVFNVNIIRLSFCFILIVIINTSGYAQNEWINNQKAFTDLLARDMYKHPRWRDQENKYSSYYLELNIQDGLITEISFSPTTPQRVISKSKENLHELNQQIKDVGIIFLKNCNVVVPIFNIWQRDEKEEDSLSETLKNLYPNDARDSCRVFLEPIVYTSYRPIHN